jgi:hypothetical protein
VLYYNKPLNGVAMVGKSKARAKNEQESRKGQPVMPWFATFPLQVYPTASPEPSGRHLIFLSGRYLMQGPLWPDQHPPRAFDNPR